MKDTRSDLGRLAERAAAGCPDALEALLGRLVGPVRDFLLAWLSGRRDARDTAQDLAQEALIRIMRGITECRARTERQVMAWALTVARNVAVDHARSERRRQESFAVTEELEAVAEGPSVVAWVVEMAGSDQRNGALMSLLAAEVAAAPEVLQEILWIRMVEGGTWGDIAGQTNMTLRAVQRRFQRFGEVLRARAFATPPGGAGAIPERSLPP